MVPQSIGMALPAPSLKAIMKASGSPPVRFVPLVMWSEQAQSMSTCGEGLAVLQESRSSARLLFLGAPRHHAVPKADLLLPKGVQLAHCLWIWPKMEQLQGTGHDKTLCMYLPAHPDMSGVTRRLLACAVPLTTALVLYGMDSMGNALSIERIGMATSALIELQVIMMQESLDKHKPVTALQNVASVARLHAPWPRVIAAGASRTPEAACTRYATGTAS